MRFEISVVYVACLAGGFDVHFWLRAFIITVMRPKPLVASPLVSTAPLLDASKSAWNHQLFFWPR